jgi:uncharacterized repeat protein (TIGR03943 family)
MRVRVPPNGRSTNWPAVLEAALLAVAGAMFLLKARQGVLVYYIHPRYTGLVVVTGLALLLVAVVRLAPTIRRPAEPARGRSAGYVLVALPLLLGLVLPARPLAANALAGKTIDAGASVRASAPADSPSQQWNLLQWATAVNVRGAEVQGQAVDVIGFVYHDPQRQFDGFVVVRHVIICCAADGSGVGLPVVWQGGAALPVDTWVRVRGTLGVATIGGRTEPAFLATAVEPVPRPANPYLYA